MTVRISMLPNISKIKIQLIERDLTQTKLARDLGISKQYLCDILQGRKRPQPIINRLVDELKFPRSLFPEKRKAA